MWLVFAAGAACCFGLRGILYQWTSKQPAERNVLLFGVYVCGAVVSLLLNAVVQQPWTPGAWMGLSMGFFSFISNSSMHKGFAVGKASIVALLSGLPPLVVVLAAYALWDERLTAGQLVAFAVIMVGGLLIKSSGGLSLQDWKGAQWGLVAMVAFAVTDLSSKQSTLWNGETLPTVAVMYTTGSLLFALAAWRSVRSSRPAPAPDRCDVPARWSVRRTLGVGFLVGTTNTGGMLLILPAFKLGVTGLVSAVIALNVLLILLYARFFLKERFKVMELTGMTLAFVGVLVLRVFG